MRRGQNKTQIGGEEKRNGRLVGAAETSKERAEWRRLQQKNLSILGLPKRKERPQCHRESSWQERRSRPCQKEKEQSRQSKAPDHEGERVKVDESRTLARKRGIRARAINSRLNVVVRSPAPFGLGRNGCGATGLPEGPSYPGHSPSVAVVVVVDYPTPSEGWGHGGRPWSPRNRATPQGLDQRS